MREPIRTSALGFGCAPIMGKIGRRRALNALAEAFDLGVTHFDVARSYGFGRAERAIGEFLLGKRDRVTITSKFGVIPPTLSLRQKLLIPPARLVANSFPRFNAGLRRKSGELLARQRFDAAYASECLNTSLRELGIDDLDVYLLHDPDPKLSLSDELLHFLDASISAGKIRRWGLTYRTPEDATLQSLPGGDIAQFECNFTTYRSVGSFLDDPRQRFVIRPFGGGSSSFVQAPSVLREPTTIAMLRDIKASLADVSLCLARAIAGRCGTVVCSMFSSSNIRSNVRAIERFDSCATMAGLIDALLGEIEHDLPLQAIQ
jgi:hypothetical protein